jgi:hypothetical protein
MTAMVLTLVDMGQKWYALGETAPKSLGGPRFAGYLPIPVGHRTMNTPIRTSAAAAALAAASTGLADDIRFFVTPESVLRFDAGASAPLAGSFVGNWDAVANPTGTRTVPGLFGGTSTTNTPIPCTAELAAGIGMDKVPAGGFRVVSEPGSATGTLEGLAFDLLGGEAAPMGVTVDLTFSTFRTFNPSSLYVGTSALPPIPLVSGQVSALRIEQAAPATVAIVATPAGTAFSGTVPSEFVIEVSLLGQPLVSQRLPVDLPVAGMVGADGTAPTASIAFKDGFSVPLPEIPAFEDQAVALPTILPPGGTANLVFDGTVDGPSGAFAVSIDLAIGLAASAEPMDLTGDGHVNGADLGVLLWRWGTNDPMCDLDKDGIVGGLDLGMIVGAWSRP